MNIFNFVLLSTYIVTEERETDESTDRTGRTTKYISCLLGLEVLSAPPAPAPAPASLTRSLLLLLISDWQPQTSTGLQTSAKYSEYKATREGHLILKYGETTNMSSLASSDGWREEGRGKRDRFSFSLRELRPGQTAWPGASDRKGRERALLDLSASSQQPPPHSTFSSERSARSGGLPTLRRTSCEA